MAMMFLGVSTAGRVARSQRALSRELAEKNAQLERDREALTQAALAQERTRIARELHDVVAHCVNVMVVQAAAESRSLGSDGNTETVAVLASIEKTGREALAEMRRVLGVLRRDGEDASLEPPGSLRSWTPWWNRCVALGSQSTSRWRV